jgi:K+-transporting ATPase A subunit
MEMQYYNWFRGYSTWIQRYGIPYYVALWMADSLGMMSNCNESFNSLETQFPIFSESV